MLSTGVGKHIAMLSRQRQRNDSRPDSAQIAKGPWLDIAKRLEVTPRVHLKCRYLQDTLDDIPSYLHMCSFGLQICGAKIAIRDFCNCLR